ncbi:alpha-L-rhamnosidase [Microbacterium enclense]|uniref:alpha-L-rhamnosidase n=1 Tax=Microbacterium enclense TaxID=993073 RepID=A0A443JSF6_9MICO|nr:family 78 glycoside hydrolase catalytic domain [Microbacterium enclense]RWR23421.1 alpha-L-rhamnosidase [Microbacterium enclense]
MIAAFIAASEETHTPPRFRRVVELDRPRGEIVSATLHWSAEGVAEAWIGETPASDMLLVPGWTAYERRLRYAETDVAALISERFVLGVQLADGWFRGRLGWTGQARIYGDRGAVFASLRIAFADGHVQTVETDASWEWSEGPVRSADLYDGQTVDAGLADDWLLADGVAVGRSVVLADEPRAELEPYLAPPVRRVATVAPQRTWMSPSGETIVDFGQNLVGYVRVRVRGPRGAIVTVRHAEVLEHGELAVRPLRSARATDRFFLSGGDDAFEPTLTFHGFRYAGVSGWPVSAPPLDENIEAVVIGSDMRRIGRFACSDPLLSRLHENVVWSMRGNFVDVPTDCPQRDERLGWTGDIAVFAETASFLFDTNEFLSDWLRDVAVEQDLAGGRVPHVVPDTLKYDPAHGGLPATDTAIWGDAAVWVPWALWRAYGDRSVLERQYSSMTAHAGRIAERLSPTGLWDTGFQFGDWLDPTAPPEDPFLARADPGVVATACAYRTFSTLARTAGILGEAVDAERFAALAARVRTAFRTHYVADGIVRSDCETVYALALVFDLLADDDRERAGHRLAQLVAASGHRISTGFAGTPFVLDALAETGHADAAFALLMQTESPSWLHPVTLGATTIWERWDSLLSDGTVNPGEMTSFNHYALGAVADFLHRRIVGIAPLTPGYREIAVSPLVGGGLTWAAGSLESPHGTIRVRWERDGDTVRLEAEVPPDCTAVIQLPGRDAVRVGAGHQTVVGTMASTLQEAS